MRKLFFVILPLVLIVFIVLFLAPAVLFYARGPFQQGVPGFQQADLSVSWESMNGPPGGSVYELFQNPYRHNEMYATTNNGIYRSEDRGESWRVMDGLGNFRVTSIAASEDRVFFCGEGGVFSLDSEGNAEGIMNGFCNRVVVSGNRLFVTFGWMDFMGIKIMYADLGSGNLNFKGISLPDSLSRELVMPLGTGFPYSVEIPDILVLGNRILANIIVNDHGSGQYTNGQLFISEDFGRSWSKIELGKEENVIVSDIMQDPDNPNHIILTLKHGILHEFKSPLSGLVKESFDGGKTWNQVTDSDIPSNGVEYVAIKDGVYYLLNTYDFFMVRLNGSSYEQMGIPEIKEFEQLQTTRPNPNPPTYSMDKLLFDYDDPDTAYGKIGSIWSFGMIKSEDGMKTWKKMDRDIVASSRTIVLPHPTDTKTTFTFGNILQESFVTRDDGKTWELFTPIGTGDEVRIDPHNTDHIIAVSESSYIYESFDSGRTFRNINEDFCSAKIFDFEIPEDNPGKIYVSNLGVGLSEYDPQRNEWLYIIGSPDYVYDFEIDPEDSDTLYAAYSPKIFESHSSVWRYSKEQKENFGWSEIFRVEDSGGITSLKFDPSDPDRMYAGVIGKEGEIYVSGDKGKTWEKLNDQFTMLTVWGQPQLIVDPDNPSVAYAATWLGGTWKTTDAGKSWTLLEGAPVSGTALSLDNSNTNIVYLADRSSPTVWKSVDGGETWKEIANFAKDRALLVMRVLADGDNVYASTFYPSLQGGKLYKSTNGGETWNDITGNLPTGILDIAVDPTDSNIVYLTTNINGAYKSTDSGETWSKMESFPDVGAYDIEVDPDDPEILYTAVRGGSMPAWFTEIAGVMGGIKFTDDAGVYKSTDSGETWSRILKTTASCRVVRRHPGNPNLLFANDIFDGLQMSSDGGETWASLEGLDNAVTTALAVVGDKIYAGTQGCGIYSGDLDAEKGTVTWQPERSNKPVPKVYNLQIRVDPKNSKNIFVTSYPGGMYASTDGGKKFSDRNAITPSVVVEDPIRQGYYTFAIDPNNSSKMWLGTWGKGIYKSYNSMVLDIPVDLFGKHVNQIVIDPDDTETVYVATMEGVFVTRDDGKHWEEMNEGLETKDVRSLRFVKIEYPPFTDDFEDGNAEGWMFQSGWSVVNDNGNQVLHGVGHTWIDLGRRTGGLPIAGSHTWADSTFESRVKFAGGVHVNYRVQGAERYFLDMNGVGVRLFRENFGNEASVFTELARSGLPVETNTWIQIKIIGNGNNIKAYVDGVLRIDYTDDDPILHGGVAFESLPDSEIYVDDVRVTSETVEKVVYAGTGGYGVYKLDHSSRTWQNLGRTLGGGWWSAWDRRMYQFSSMLFDPDVPGKVYYGHFPGGFFISEDNGRTWKDSSLGLGNDGIFSLSMHPLKHSILFAGTYNGVAKSSDGGKTWELKSNGMPPEQWPYMVAIDSDNPDIMYVATKNGQNKGFCDRNVFCGVLMKSTDGGESWFRIMNGLWDRSEFYAVLIYPEDHDILFLSTNMGVYISRDAGNSWKTLNSGLPSTNNQVRDNVAENLAITPDNKHLILGLVEYGLWKADLSNLMK